MFANRKFFLIILVISLIKIWLIAGIDIVGYSEAMYDDGLFIRNAKSLYRFGWLGSYNNLTLIKGPFYPTFIAINYWTGIPLLISEAIVYFLACILVLYVVRKKVNNDYFLVFLFILLAFNPITYTTDLRRVIREGIYPALSILTIFSFIKLYITDTENLKERKKWIWLCGIALSCFWLTKEDGIWLMPALIFIVFYFILDNYYKQRKITLKDLLFVASPFLILILFINAVSIINKVSYGLYNTVELKNKQFIRAYASLQRVKTSKEVPFVPVTKETREHLYKTIPSFAELKEFEDSVFRAWAVYNPYCKTIPEACGETAGGWFVWALRDAAARKGYHKDAQTAQAYYERLADEVNAACEGGKLDCYPENNSLTPRLNQSHIKPFFKAFFYAGRFIIRFENFSMNEGESWGEEEYKFLFEEITNSQLASEKRRELYDSKHSMTKLKSHILGGIVVFYQEVIPILFYASLICLVIILFIRIKTKTISVFTVISAVLMVAIACRIGILALVHASSFSAISILYLSPVYPLILILIFLLLLEVYQLFRVSA